MIRKVWRDLVDLYGLGGIEVLTMAPSGGVTGVPVVRSVIQPDADVMTWVEVEHLSEEAWQRHLVQLQGKVMAIQCFRTFFRRDMEFALRLLLFANLLRSILFQELLDVILSFLLMLVLPYLLRLVVQRVLQQLLKRAIAAIH